MPLKNIQEIRNNLQKKIFLRNSKENLKTNSEMQDFKKTLGHTQLGKVILDDFKRKELRRLIRKGSIPFNQITECRKLSSACSTELTKLFSLPSISSKEITTIYKRHLSEIHSLVESFPIKKHRAAIYRQLVIEFNISLHRNLIANLKSVLKYKLGKDYLKQIALSEAEAKEIEKIGKFTENSLFEIFGKKIIRGASVKKTPIFMYRYNYLLEDTVDNTSKFSEKLEFIGKDFNRIIFTGKVPSVGGGFYNVVNKTIFLDKMSVTSIIHEFSHYCLSNIEAYDSENETFTSFLETVINYKLANDCPKLESYDLYNDKSYSPYIEGRILGTFFVAKHKKDLQKVIPFIKNYFSEAEGVIGNDDRHLLELNEEMQEHPVIKKLIRKKQEQDASNALYKALFG